MVQIRVRNATLLKGCAAMESCNPPGRKKKWKSARLSCASDTGEYGHHQALCGKLVSSYKALVQLQDRYICGLSVKR